MLRKKGSLQQFEGEGTLECMFYLVLRGIHESVSAGVFSAPSIPPPCTNIAICSGNAKQILLVAGALPFFNQRARLQCFGKKGACSSSKERGHWNVLTSNHFFGNFGWEIWASTLCFRTARCLRPAPCPAAQRSASPQPVPHPAVPPGRALDAKDDLETRLKKMTTWRFQKLRIFMDFQHGSHFFSHFFWQVARWQCPLWVDRSSKKANGNKKDVDFWSHRCFLGFWDKCWVPNSTYPHEADLFCEPFDH